MQRKISSSLTEFFKVYSVFIICMLLWVYGIPFSGSMDFAFSLFFMLMLIVCIHSVFELSKLKDVEMTDSGLIITERFFFTQKSIFVPYEKIEAVKSRFRWLGGNSRMIIKFTEDTEFGEKISFLTAGFTRKSQSETIEELNRTRIRSKTAEQLNSAFPEKDRLSD